MPTIPIYVSASISRQLAARWGIEPDGDELVEVVRSLTMATLEKAAGISHPRTPFSHVCAWANLHRAGYRCRHCGGS